MCKGKLVRCARLGMLLNFISLLVGLTACSAESPADRVSNQATGRISSLVDAIKTGAPKDPNTSLKAGIIIVSVYPSTFFTVKEEMLRDSAGVQGKVHIIASADSQETATIAIVSIIQDLKGDTPAVQTFALRWERSHWVQRSFGELVLKDD